MPSFQFTFFFAELYKEENLIEVGLGEYLKGISIPKFSKEDIFKTKTLTVHDFLCNKETEKDKAPSPDEMIAIYYKCLEDKIILPINKNIESDKWKVITSVIVGTTYNIEP